MAAMAADVAASPSSAQLGGRDMFSSPARGISSPALATSPLGASKRPPQRRGDRRQGRSVGRLYDPAVVATHDKISGAANSMSAWRVPRTTETQRILHSTSHIIDTFTRQRTAKHLIEHIGMPLMDSPSSTSGDGSGIRLLYNGTMSPAPSMRGSRSLSSLQDPESWRETYGVERVVAEQAWLPPWVSRSDWNQATHPAQLPAWAGQPGSVLQTGSVPPSWSTGRGPGSAPDRPVDQSTLRLGFKGMTVVQR